MTPDNQVEQAVAQYEAATRLLDANPERVSRLARRRGEAVRQILEYRSVRATADLLDISPSRVWTISQKGYTR